MIFIHEPDESINFGALGERFVRVTALITYRGPDIEPKVELAKVLVIFEEKHMERQEFDATVWLDSWDYEQLIKEVRKAYERSHDKEAG